ncbi:MULTISPECIES: 1-phosphofructokinase family hexose kinase [Gordonia]|uniref:1-phosphofructokinase n=1 Tax=Gordonia sihwensis NBRC 108236 TaxID=1223544 RepID=L7LLE9_9ACTN|nr:MULTISPECIES: hexose kinase [Gordonia]AUH69214.1 1-phosphofructokinase [Gordonia sp. YC-JH1]KXT57818.1 1-phosphofructokinase [Gordonia sp. QH-12]GAC60878.1 1-phosphofructokinase [Gordonia sihwensis NBRC 108236]
MIVTVTANPSTDRTIELAGPLRRGEVHRAARVVDQPGGKGINVARVVRAAGLPTLAVLPARADDPFIDSLRAVALPHQAVSADGTVRTNLTVAEPDGTTTKINDAGTAVSAEAAAALRTTIMARAEGADWLALCGSLPPGLPDDWYAQVLAATASLHCRVAVDTSGAPLAAVAAARPALLKPNSDELAELTGDDPAGMERSAAQGDPSVAAAASRTLADRTGGTVLTTLGAAGALLTTPDGIWFATAPAVAVRSTVGAGDASLAGYLIAHLRGADEAGLLRSAVAHGSAAAALPGTTPPTPDLLDEAGVSVSRLS